MSAAETFRAEAVKRVLVKDGAYGTLIQARGLAGPDYCAGVDLLKDQRGNNDLLNLTQPDIVREICESFAKAGAAFRPGRASNGGGDGGAAEDEAEYPSFTAGP